MERRSELSRRYADRARRERGRNKKGVESLSGETGHSTPRGAWREERRRDVLKAVLETEIDYSLRGLFVSDAQNGDRDAFMGEKRRSHRDPG